MARPLTRFRFRTLMIGVTVVCVALAWFVGPFRGQQKAIEELRSAEPYASVASIEVMVIPGPAWLPPAFAKTFQTAVMVRMRGDRADRYIRHVKHLPFLRQLYLDHSTISDAGLQAVAGLRELETIGLARTRISDVGLKHLLRCRRLKLLDISNTLATHECLANLPIDINAVIANQRVWNAGALPHLQRFSRLKVCAPLIGDGLDLSFACLHDEDLDYLCGVGVQSLVLRGNDLTNEVLPKLKAIRRLKDVDLSGTKVTREASQRFAQETGVSVIHESAKTIRNRALHWVRKRGIVARHNEDKYQPIGLSTAALHGYGQGMECLPSLKTLTELKVPMNYLAENTLHFVEGIPNLRKLRLVGGPGVNGWEAQDWWLLYLSKAWALEELAVPHGRITGWSVAELAGLPRLRVLDLSHNPLVDGQLAALAQLPALRELSLTSTPITDDGLTALYPLTQLEHLDLHGCRVSGSAVNRLRQKLPSTQIVTDRSAPTVPAE